MLNILDAHEEPRLAQVRTLFEEYAVALDFHLCFREFQEEFAGLPGAYAPPRGFLLLAEYDGQAAGCVALRPLDEAACELKRLYVRPACRGLRIGRTLTETITRRARAIGYRWMQLDTLPSMERARALYAAMGFREIEPYNIDPVEGALCMELNLR